MGKILRHIICMFYYLAIFGYGSHAGAPPEVETTGGTAPSGSYCSYPFEYKGELYQECITNDRDRLWCATTYDYDRDKLWGYCVPEEECATDMEKVGCFRDTGIPDRPYPFHLLSYRLPTLENLRFGLIINWKQWPQSLNKLRCECAKLAKNAGYRYFGLQFYGECWSGPSLSYARDGASNQCVGVDFKPCDDSASEACAGKASTNYIYRVK